MRSGPRSRRRIAVLATAELLPAAGPAPAAQAAGAAEKRESVWCRLRWWISYALLQAYGPAQLSGGDDPRQQMLAARASHRGARSRARA